MSVLPVRRAVRRAQPEPLPPPVVAEPIVILVEERRRTYLRADVRRAQILDVAKDVFSRRGYRLANVADICAAARIGRGTLYQYFANKQDVLLALMEDLATRVRQVLDQRPVP